MATNGNDNIDPAPPTAIDSAGAFTEDEVLCRTKITDAPRLFKALIQLLAPLDPGVNPETALQAILDREALGSTALAPGIALPHARLEGVRRPLVALATSEAGIQSGQSPDPVHLFILILTPAQSPGAYLNVVASLARLLRQPGFLDEVLAQKTATGLAALFHGAHRDPNLPPYVCAADMMSPPPAILHDTNSVKDAIDIFVRTGLAHIAVVDKDGDLVGVVSTQTILGICLPDYLLWMEDLSRYSNFEPFETLLARESSTWLADITDDTYASVTFDRPAIAVAEAMARQKTNVCFVTEGSKLVGVISLRHFLHNVFRD